MKRETKKRLKIPKSVALWVAVVTLTMILGIGLLHTLRDLATPHQELSEVGPGPLPGGLNKTSPADPDPWEGTRDLPVGVSSTESGSALVLVNNTWFDPLHTNGTLNVTINIPEGRVLSELTLEIVATAQNHTYVGFPSNGTADGFKYIAPGSGLRAVMERVELSHCIRPAGVWGRIMTVDNASIDDAGRSYYLEMLDADGSDYPDNVIIDESYDFTTNQLPYAWHYFPFSSIVNTTVTGTYWIGFNASKLNYTGSGGLTSSDHLRSPFQNLPGADNQVVQWLSPAGYGFLDDRHMPFRLVGQRIGADNDTWQAPSAEALNLSATIGEETALFSDNTTHFEQPTDESGDLAILLGSNLSVLVNVSWEARYEAPGKDRRHPAESYAPGRKPHEPPPEAPPYEPTTFLERYGWYVFWCGILVTAIIIVALLWRRGLVPGPFALVAVAVLAVSLATLVGLALFTPDLLLPAVEWGDALVTGRGWEILRGQLAPLLEGYGWYTFWCGVLVAAAVIVALLWRKGLIPNLYALVAVAALGVSFAVLVVLALLAPSLLLPAVEWANALVAGRGWQFWADFWDPIFKHRPDWVP